eukprot:2808501-Pleurochrysis_carterae.AAC.5
MDNTVATMTPSVQLAPVHALLHAPTDAPDAAAGKGVRRGTHQLNSGEETPGSKANLVRNTGTLSPSVAYDYTPRPLRLYWSAGPRGAVAGRAQDSFAAPRRLQMPRDFVPTNASNGNLPTADAQRLKNLSNLVRAVLESVSIETPHLGGSGAPRPPLPQPPTFPPTHPPHLHSGCPPTPPTPNASAAADGQRQFRGWRCG